MEAVHDFFNLIYGQLVGYEYIGIVVMMAVESSFIPFPSEIVMIPAGIEIANNQMNFFLAVFYGTLGSWIGSTVNYLIARYYGRTFLEKYGRFVRIDLEKINKLDRYFINHGKITVFIVRFIPLVRQYISFPAGMAKMNFAQFSLYTCLGAGIWVFVLTYIGYSFGADYGAIFLNKQINFELMKELLSPQLNKLTLIALGILAVLTAIYYFFNKRFLVD
ncbi:MAG: DedA family protein [Calditrichaeota bacterium]|nr:DedA family protein [Calditrichota bacterium]